MPRKRRSSSGEEEVVVQPKSSKENVSTKSPASKSQAYIRAFTNFLFTSTAIIVTCIKFMLIPTYYSTDFEVHRNWMAITSKLPLSKWYTEKTSQWTLDYPPFFAYFELLLSYFAPYFDPQMLQITSQPYTSPATVFYQRLTVIVSDVIYYYAVYIWLNLLTDPKKQASHGLTLFARPANAFATNQFTSSTFLYIFLFLFNVGHLLVDHIHFQYNGLLNGILLLSMARMVNGQIYWSAFWFAVLLNFKHIYLYMAPAYFVFLLIEHCLTINRSNLLGSRIHFGSLAILATIVLSVFGVSFGPFIAKGQLGNLLGRLFPFQRGLSHAYWAPNVWALYNGADLVLAKLLRRPAGSSTSGLVQQSEHAVLPSISPAISLALVLVLILVSSVSFTWNRSHASPSSTRIRRRRSVVFIELVLLSTLAFFTFGYHVHEKAILLVIPPMIPLILANPIYGRLFLLLSTTGYYSLFPLLFREAETLLKILLLALHVAFTVGSLASHYPTGQRGPSAVLGGFSLPLLSLPETLYLFGFLPLQLSVSLGPYLAPGLYGRLPFLPLLSTSLYCTVGVVYCTAALLRQQLAIKEEEYKGVSDSTTTTRRNTRRRED